MAGLKDKRGFIDKERLDLSDSDIADRVEDYARALAG